MESKMIRCPKCSHEQLDGLECNACGLIFAKYVDPGQNRQGPEPVEKRRSKGASYYFHAVVLVVVTAAVTYHFTRPAPSPSPAIKPKAAQVRVMPAIPKTKGKRTEPEQAEAHRKDPPAASAADSIEKAREATVSIETPWGAGSGFFVSNNCIVTSRHVLQVEPAELVKARRELKRSKEMIDTAKHKIEEWRDGLRKTSSGSKRIKLRKFIEQREEELKKGIQLYEEAERQVQKMERPVYVGDIKVVLANGSSQIPSDLQLSRTRDLAILTIYVSGSSVLHRPPLDSPLHPGDKLYAVGCPVGLRNTVTGGIFSGYRKRESDKEVFLQTDAPINPGNSGGPLIDEQGFVRGVNTMILRNTEGIGFAIPIDQVFEEFDSSIH